MRLVVLFSTGDRLDWPDTLDELSGDFTYYGDNRSPGRELHDTRRLGNLLLRQCFEKSRQGPDQREQVPPFLLFDRPSRGWHVRFRGLLAPGSPSLSGDEELVAIWRSSGGNRFQNYRSHFTVLDEPAISRTWINQILRASHSVMLAPAAGAPGSAPVRTSH